MNTRVRIFVAFGMLFFFAFVIWKPSITGRVTAVETQEVVVVLKSQETNAITGAAAFDETPSFEAMKETTAEVQQEVLDDVNSPSFADRLLFRNPPPDAVAERTMEIVPAMVVKATAEGIEELKDHPLVEAVYPNIEFQLYLAQSVPLIQADKVWQIQVNGNNITGQNVSVCVVDTGISPHVDFQNRIVNQKCFCSPNCCPNGQSTDTIATDTHPVSHGTHVSGIVAINGPAYKGVAPGANIVAVKVCNTGCGLADIFAGIDYCLQVKDAYNVVAISGSLGDGGNYQTQDQCPTFFDSAIDAAYSAGITSVFASGNNGFSNGISYPGCSPNAISVGATDKNDVIAGFTNRGALLDVLAPGVSIVSSKAGNTYGALSGTSQATPHVSGAVALLQQYALENNMTLTPDQIRQILQSTGKPIGNWKRIDLLAAIQSIAPSPTPEPTPSPTPEPTPTPTPSEQPTPTPTPDPTPPEQTPTPSPSPPVTCHAELDQNSNGDVDIGDFVALLTQFAQEDISCITAQSTCVVELDQNSNGDVDIGDFIILLTSFAQGNINDVDGRAC